MANNPNTPQTPKKSFFRKALDAVLGSDSDSLAEMKRLNKKAEDEGEFNPKEIKEKKAYAELLKKEEAAKKKKRQDEVSTVSKTRSGAKSAIDSLIGGKKGKKGPKESKRTGLPELNEAKGLEALQKRLEEAEASDIPDDKDFLVNLSAMCGIIGLLRNHELMDGKFDQEAILDADQSDKDKYESIVTHRGYDVNNLQTLLRAVLTAISGVEISKAQVMKWVESDKLLALNIIFNETLGCNTDTPDRIVDKKLSAINPAMNVDVAVWEELDKITKALRFWQKNSDADSSETMKHHGIKKGIPGEHKIGMNFIKKILGGAPAEPAVKKVELEEVELEQSQPEPQPEGDDSHETEAPAPETSKILDIGKVREMATGEIARSIELLDTFKLEINKKAEDAVFATGSSPLKSDDEVINAIEDCEVGGDNPLDGFGEALIDSSKDIGGGGERKITKDILKIIADWKGIKDEMELIMQIPEVAKHLKDIFPQL